MDAGTRDFLGRSGIPASALGRLVINEAKPDVAGAEAGVAALPRGGAVALAVIGRAKIAAPFHRARGHAGIERIIGVIRVGALRIIPVLGIVAGAEEVGGHFPDIADHVVKPIGVGLVAADRGDALEPVGFGVVIGKGGNEVDKIKEELKQLTNKDVQINIFEIKRPELDAKLVGESIAQQIEARISYKRAMKQAIASAMRVGAEGIKIKVSGRLAGADMARAEQYKEGRIPLHTLRADIDYAISESQTVYGKIGIKVWIFKGEIYGKRDLSPNVGIVSNAQAGGAGQHKGGGDRGGDRGGRRRGGDSGGGRGGDRRSGGGGDRRGGENRGPRR